MKVNVFVWKASQEQLSLVERIVQVIQDKTNVTIEFQIQDTYSITPSTEDVPTITFGKMARTQVPNGTSLLYRLPDLRQLEPLPDNKTTRLEVADKLSQIAQRLTQYAEQTEEAVEITVETQGTSIGVGAGNIQLTQDEIDNLLKIKQLLNGGTVIIKKGDIRIEVPDGETIRQRDMDKV